MSGDALSLIALGIFVVGASSQPAGSTGLLAIPGKLFEKQTIDGGELASADSAARLMASWRRRGALIGAAMFAVPAMLGHVGIPLSVVAVLAGAAAGLAAAQWWRTPRPSGAVRIAGLERRTIIGSVGTVPMMLLALSFLAAAAASVAWLVARSHTGDKLIVVPLASGTRTRTCSFDLYTPPLSGPAIGWASALLATAVALTSATAVARRGVNPTLARPADTALREAGIRTALGSAIAVVASLAAGMLFELRSLLNDAVLLQGNCGTPTGWNTARSDLLLVAGVIAVVVAMTGLLSYVLFPGRTSTTDVERISA